MHCRSLLIVSPTLRSAIHPDFEAVQVNTSILDKVIHQRTAQCVYILLQSSEQDSDLPRHRLICTLNNPVALACAHNRAPNDISSTAVAQAADILDDRPERGLLVAFLRRCFCCFSFNGLYYVGDVALDTQMCALTSAGPSVMTPAARVSADYPPLEKRSRVGSENDPTTCSHCENGSKRSHLLPPGGAWPPQLPFSRRGTPIHKTRDKTFGDFWNGDFQDLLTRPLRNLLLKSQILHLNIPFQNQRYNKRLGASCVAMFFKTVESGLSGSVHTIHLEICTCSPAMKTFSTFDIRATHADTRTKTSLPSIIPSHRFVISQWRGSSYSSACKSPTERPLSKTTQIIKIRPVLPRSPGSHASHQGCQALRRLRSRANSAPALQDVPHQHETLVFNLLPVLGLTTTSDKLKALSATGSRPKPP